jgi:hypothetical protein
MAASNTHIETQTLEQLAKVVKSDGSIRGSAQYLPQRLARAHADILYQDCVEK